MIDESTRERSFTKLKIRINVDTSITTSLTASPPISITNFVQYLPVNFLLVSRSHVAKCKTFFERACFAELA